MKEIRVKLEDDTHISLTKDAATNGTFAAVHAKTVLENKYKDNFISCFLLPKRIEDARKAAAKQDVSLEVYVQTLLDKVLPSDTMASAVIQFPRNLKGAELKNYFSKKIDSMVK